MLKTIIENNRINSLLNEILSPLYSVRILNMRDFGKVILKHQSFVVFAGRAGFVASAQNPDFSSCLLDLLGQPNHHGGFARSTEGEIADGEDFATKF